MKKFGVMYEIKIWQKNLSVQIDLKIRFLANLERKNPFLKTFEKYLFDVHRKSDFSTYQRFFFNLWSHSSVTASNMEKLKKNSGDFIDHFWAKIVLLTKGTKFRTTTCGNKQIRTTWPNSCLNENFGKRWKFSDRLENRTLN